MRERFMHLACASYPSIEVKCKIYNIFIHTYYNISMQNTLNTYKSMHKRTHTITHIHTHQQKTHIQDKKH